MTDNQRIARGISKAPGMFLVLAVAATLIGVWPRESVPASGIYPGERIEVRSYVIPWGAVDDGENVVVARLKELQWRLANPGLVGIQAAARKVEERHPSAEQFTQMVFEELGYNFQKGCSARYIWGSSGTVISHYPSMLDNMEQSLGLRSYRQKPLQPTGSGSLPIR